MYREKIRQLANAALAKYGTDVSSPSVPDFPHNRPSPGTAYLKC